LQVAVVVVVVNPVVVDRLAQQVQAAVQQVRVEVEQVDQERQTRVVAVVLAVVVPLPQAVLEVRA
jgi:hypothetical protein